MFYWLRSWFSSCRYALFKRYTIEQFINAFRLSFVVFFLVGPVGSVLFLLLVLAQHVRLSLACYVAMHNWSFGLIQLVHTWCNLSISFFPMFFLPSFKNWYETQTFMYLIRKPTTHCKCAHMYAWICKRHSTHATHERTHTYKINPLKKKKQENQKRPKQY